MADVSKSDECQWLARRRYESYEKLGVFAQAARVSSKANVWADQLSRGEEQDVRRKAAALGFRCEQLEVPPAVRSFQDLEEAMRRLRNA